jgi:hypothetical protein
LAFISSTKAAGEPPAVRARGVRGVVARLDHHRIQQIVDREDLALFQPHLRAADLGIIGRDGDWRLGRERAAGQLVVHDGEGHELGHARRG